MALTVIARAHALQLGTRSSRRAVHQAAVYGHVKHVEYEAPDFLPHELANRSACASKAGNPSSLVQRPSFASSTLTVGMGIVRRGSIP